MRFGLFWSWETYRECRGGSEVMETEVVIVEVEEEEKRWW